MSNDDLISLCSAIRTTIDTLHELASGIDADIGRRQIYGEADAINSALERTRALATTIELLESQLFACATPAIERPRNTLEDIRNSAREAA